MGWGVGGIDAKNTHKLLSWEVSVAIFSDGSRTYEMGHLGARGAVGGLHNSKK